jgi:predicted membrane protein
MNDNGLITRILVGFFLVLLGTGFLLDQLGLNVLGINVFNFWPLIFFIIGLPMLFRRNIIGGLFFIALGLAFLLANFFGYSIFAIIWPLIIIVVGFSIVFRPNRYKHLGTRGEVVAKDSIDESLVFWGTDQIIKSDNFQGGHIECVFGGFKLDLREAKIKDGAVLDVSCVFGGGELYLPRDVRVQLEGTSVMGGVTNNTLSRKEGDPTFRIVASAVFGGIDIKN